MPADYAGTGSIQPAVFRQSSTDIQFLEKASGTSGPDKVIATFPALATATVVPVGAPLSYLSPTVVPTTTTQLAVTAQPPATVAAGAGFGLTVTAETSTGAVDPTFNGTVTLSLANNAGGSGTALGGTLTATAVNGVATFSGLTLNNPGNGYTLKATAGSLSVTTSGFNVGSSTATATQLVVTAQPPATVAAGAGFGLTVTAETSTGAVDPTFNGTVTLSLANNAGGSGTVLGGTLTATAVNGVATFSGLTLNKPGNGYTLVVSTNGLTSAMTAPFSVMSPPPPAPTPPVIIGQSVLFTRKTNRRGKPVGRPVLAGFEIDFSTSMNPVTTGNANNFRLGQYVTRRVGRKVVKVLKAVRFTERFDSSNNSVKLLVAGRPTFTRGGQITLVATPPGGISSAAGVLLDGDNNGTPGDNGTFTIIARARGITRP